MNKEKLYKEAINKWGKDSQIDMIEEECYELCHAIQKQKRYGTSDTFRNVCEEIADVEIMLEQLDVIFLAKHRIVLNDLQEKEFKHLCTLIPIEESVKSSCSILTEKIIDWRNHDSVGNVNRIYKYRQTLNIALRLLKLKYDSETVDFIKRFKLERLEQRLKD